MNTIPGVLNVTDDAAHNSAFYVVIAFNRPLQSIGIIDDIARRIDPHVRITMEFNIDHLSIFRSPCGRSDMPRIFPEKAVSSLKNEGITTFDVDPDELDGIDLCYFSIRKVPSNIWKRFITICEKDGLSLRGEVYGRSNDRRVGFESE